MVQQRVTSGWLPTLPRALQQLIKRVQVTVDAGGNRTGLHSPVIKSTVERVTVEVDTHADAAGAAGETGLSASAARSGAPEVVVHGGEIRAQVLLSALFQQSADIVRELFIETALLLGRCEPAGEKQVEPRPPSWRVL